MRGSRRPYRKSLWRRALNAVVRPLAKLGLTGPRTHLLTVPGRASGQLWSTAGSIVRNGRALARRAVRRPELGEERARGRLGGAQAWPVPRASRRRGAAAGAGGPGAAGVLPAGPRDAPVLRRVARVVA